MKKLCKLIVDAKWIILVLIIAATVISAILVPKVVVEYDNTKYLPDGLTSQAIDISAAEFGDYGVLQVMVDDKTMKETIAIKKKIEAVTGVQSVMYIDDMLEGILASMAQGGALPPGITLEYVIDNWETFQAALPEETKPQIAKFYLDKKALFSVTLAYPSASKQSNVAVADIRAAVGDCYLMGMPAMTVGNIESTNREVIITAAILVPFLLLILLLATKSFIEPLIVLIVIGISIIINMGTNALIPSISYMTYATSSILQLALSLDYAIFLLHRYHTEKKAIILAKGYSENQLTRADNIEAVVLALKHSFSPISASSLTTIAGFVALMFMRYTIGFDLGLVLGKGIVISLLTVFLLLPTLLVLFNRAVVRTSHREVRLPFAAVGKLVVKARNVIPAIMAIIIIPCMILSYNNDFLYGDTATMGSPGTRYDNESIAINDVFPVGNNIAVLVPKDKMKELALVAKLMSLDDVSVDSLAAIEMSGVSATNKVSANFLGKTDYDRVIITANYPDEGAGTTAFIESVRTFCYEIYGDNYHLLGTSVAGLEVKEIVSFDYIIISLLSLLLVGLIVALTFKGIVLPLVLLVVIQSGIWINMAIPVLLGTPLLFIGYMIVSCLQLGATIDYAILLSSSYREMRTKFDKYTAIKAAMTDCSKSLFTSAGVLFATGTVLGISSSISGVSALGFLIGRGAAISFVLVITLLPSLMLILDKFSRGKKALALPQYCSVSRRYRQFVTPIGATRRAARRKKLTKL